MDTTMVGTQSQRDAPSATSTHTPKRAQRRPHPQHDQGRPRSREIRGLRAKLGAHVQMGAHIIHGHGRRPVQRRSLSSLLELSGRSSRPHAMRRGARCAPRMHRYMVFMHVIRCIISLLFPLLSSPLLFSPSLPLFFLLSFFFLSSFFLLSSFCCI